MPARAKLAVITGASRGLGLAIAEVLAARGYHLILVGRDRRALERAAARLPHATAAVCDIRKPDEVARLAALVWRRKRIDVLVNNAGIAGPSEPIASLDYAAWSAVIDTNLHGTFLVTQALLPLLGKGGVIVNNLSAAARTSFPGMAAYNASKRGLLAFTETLREELRPRGIRVLALLPGATATGIWKQFWPDAPRRRMLAPHSVAEALAAALSLPAEASVDEIVINPSGGAL